MKKKLLLLVAVFCFLGIGLQAQETMSKGRLVGSARAGFSNVGIPVAVAADYGIVSGFINGNAAVSVGGELGIFTGRTDERGAFVDFSLSARGNFHYEFVENLDTYAGVNVGLGIGNDFWPYVTAHVGARYYFTEKFGVNAEIGAGTGFNLSAGVSYKFL